MNLQKLFLVFVIFLFVVVGCSKNPTFLDELDTANNVNNNRVDSTSTTAVVVVDTTNTTVVVVDTTITIIDTTVTDTTKTTDTTDTTVVPPLPPPPLHITVSFNKPIFPRWEIDTAVVHITAPDGTVIRNYSWYKNGVRWYPPASEQPYQTARVLLKSDTVQVVVFATHGTTAVYETAVVPRDDVPPLPPVVVLTPAGRKRGPIPTVIDIGSGEPGGSYDPQDPNYQLTSLMGEWFLNGEFNHLGFNALCSGDPNDVWMVRVHSSLTGMYTEVNIPVID